MLLKMTPNALDGDSSSYSQPEQQAIDGVRLALVHFPLFHEPSFCRPRERRIVLGNDLIRSLDGQAPQQVRIHRVSDPGLARARLRIQGAQAHLAHQALDSLAIHRVPRPPDDQPAIAGLQALQACPVPPPQLILQALLAVQQNSRRSIRPTSLPKRTSIP